MNYKYTEKMNYEDYASGRVIYHQSNRPNYPVRLASEIFQRCLSYVDKNKVTLYDPCCGGAYLLTVLGLLHGDYLAKIIGSDIDRQAVEMAQSNVRLLSLEGLDSRKQQLEQLFITFNKSSHKDALESVAHFKTLIGSRNGQIPVQIMQLDAFKELSKEAIGEDLDIIITDVPYGNLVAWNDVDDFGVNGLMDSIGQISTKKTIIALSMDKSQKLSQNIYNRFMRLEKFNVGKRKIEILKLSENELV